jgi:hypothetical protein
LIRSKWLIAASTLALTALTSAHAEPGGLLFRASLDHDLTAEIARGQAEPIFADKVKMVADGAVGGAVAEGDEQVLAWSAPGNIHAQRGTLSLLLALARAGRPRPFVGVPRRLSRPFQLGHGLPAHRLERPRLRRLRHRHQPGPHAGLVRHAPAPAIPTPGRTWPSPGTRRRA